MLARDVRTPVTESWVPGLLAAQTHHQVGHIALTSVMKGEGQIQQDLQEQQQRGVRVMSGRCDNRRRCRCHRQGGSGPELERAGRRSGALYRTAGGSSRPDARSAEQRAREPDSGRPARLDFDRCRQRNASNQKQLQYLIANDARVCHIPVDAELLVDRKNAAEIEVNRVVQHARQCVPAQQLALLCF